MEQAVFVGAIQAQGLAISITDHATPLEVATNNMFFIGILLNVVGAYYALITASSLEANLSQLKSFFQSKKDEDLVKITQTALSPLTRRIVDSYCLDRKVDLANAQSSPDRQQSPADTTLQNLSLSIERDQMAGSLGIAVIFLGFATCLGAFLCLAVSTKRPAMWITTLVVVVMLLLLCAVVRYIHILQPMMRRLSNTAKGVF